MSDMLNTAGNNMGAGVGEAWKGFNNMIGNPDPITAGLGVYIGAKLGSKGLSTKAGKAAWEGARKGVVGNYRALVMTLGEKAGWFTKGIPGVGLVVTGYQIGSAGSDAIDERDAGLQALSSKMAKMSPVMQTVYNGSLQWQNKRITSTIDTLDGIMAWMYTLVPMFIAFTFFGFYKAAVFMDLGKQGAQLGQSTGMMAGMLATRMRGGSDRDPPP